jgi:hypothetical protein
MPAIPETDAVYTNFESAVKGFLRDRFDSWMPGKVGGKVGTVELLMHGPVNTEKDQKEFNRAMNRLLWGVRTIRPGDDENDNTLSSGFKVKVQALQKNDQEPTGPDWTFEDTGGPSE